MVDPRSKPAPVSGTHTSNDPASIVRYYSESASDYRAWSPHLNMHFGYWRWGLNPLRLEPMLDEMTEQVLQRAGVPDAPEGTCVLDLGCGMGAPARYTAKRYPQVQVLGLTLVPLQVHEARRLSVEECVEDQIRLAVADYGRAPLETGAFDIAYAIESACHAPGYSKRRFVREAARLLESPGRLVVADGFLKGTGPMNPLLAWCYRKVCANWALETFAEIDSFRPLLGGGGLRADRDRRHLLPAGAVGASRAVGDTQVPVEGASYRAAADEPGSVGASLGLRVVTDRGDGALEVWILLGLGTAWGFSGPREVASARASDEPELDFISEVSLHPPRPYPPLINSRPL